MTSSQSCSLMLWIIRSRRMPALFTRTSTPPKASSAVRRIASAEVTEPTGSWLATARRPASVIARATSSAPVELASLTSTCAPSSDRATATARQGIQEARLRKIRHMLDNAEIIQGDDDDVIKPGKLVTIRYEGYDESETYFLGLREEKGGEHDVLTPDSPVGRALVGRSTGERVLAKVPAGELVVEIMDVRAP